MLSSIGGAEGNDSVPFFRMLIYYDYTITKLLKLREKNSNAEKKIQKTFLVGIIVAIPALGLLTIGLTATTVHADGCLSRSWTMHV
jgi:hypothetical protein